MMMDSGWKKISLFLAFYSLLRSTPLRAQEVDSSLLPPSLPTSGTTEQQMNAMDVNPNVTSAVVPTENKVIDIEIIRDPFESGIKTQAETSGESRRESIVTSDVEPQSSDIDSADSANDDYVAVTDSIFTRFLLREYQLTAILWNVKAPKAIFKTPSGEMIKIQLGYRLGKEGGVVWKIREKEVLCLIPYRGDFHNARIYTHRLAR